MFVVLTEINARAGRDIRVRAIVAKNELEWILQQLLIWLERK